MCTIRVFVHIVRVLLQCRHLLVCALVFVSVSTRVYFCVQMLDTRAAFYCHTNQTRLIKYGIPTINSCWLLLFVCACAVYMGKAGKIKSG